MCQCDTDAPTRGHCMREKLSLKRYSTETIFHIGQDVPKGRDVHMGSDVHMGWGVQTRVMLYVSTLNIIQAGA